MESNNENFLKYLAQTSTIPLAIEIKKAEGVWLFDSNNKKYLDLISGIAVNNIGHCHPEVINAIQDQIQKHLHVMVYGEFVLEAQVKLAKLIQRTLPEPLNNIYFVNSGSEAIEGAIKLAKRATGKPKIISFDNAYHGSTHGALSMIGDEALKQPFQPLLPEVNKIKFNDFNTLDEIDNKTACVVIETIQGEAGAIVPKPEFMRALRKKCDETQSLLILDEVQCGFGRTGKLWAFEHYSITPDIIVTAKGLGGGLPLGAFISSKEIMDKLSFDPALGHITTFGGNPVSCAAAYATLNVIIKNELYKKAESKERLFRKNLNHPAIKSINGKGLMLAVEFDSFETNKKIIDSLIKKGVITDWFLFAPKCLRIAPPLTISEEQINYACSLIIDTINEEA